MSSFEPFPAMIPSAFQPEETLSPPDAMGPTCTGTQDLLLYRDIVEATVEATFSDAGLVSQADELAVRLRAPREPGRAGRFDEKGNPLSGSGL